MKKQEDVAIRVSGVSKSFKLPHEKHDSIKSVFMHGIRRKKTYEKQEVLKDISFEIKKGEFFGIVGRNGGGKSTLLKLLAGIYTPDSGSIQVNGKLTPFIELGVGFNHELTGRENVFLNGALLGFSRAEMEAMYDEIVEFAELEKFMDQKLKNYSSGMQVRLAFSIAIRANTEILVLDEVLAVGDAAFQKKCFDIFRIFKNEGRTVVLVTHDMSAVQRFCTSALFLRKGNIEKMGDVDEVAKAYNNENLEALVSKEKGKTEDSEPKKEYSPAKITSVKMLNNGNTKMKTYYRPGDDIKIEVKTKFMEDVENPIIGLVLKDSQGQRLFDTNTRVHKIATGLCRKGDVKTARFSIQNILSDGKYSVYVAVASQDASIFYDVQEEAAKFSTGGWDFPTALIQPENSLSLE
jgi:ABC-2 type transport system ATP-binding protein